MPRRPALPKDPSQRAKAILDMAVNTSETSALPLESDATKLARLGGLKGGHARAVSLTAKARKAIAKKAAEARWGSDKSKPTGKGRAGDRNQRKR
jgi:hypothetical protein